MATKLSTSAQTYSYTDKNWVPKVLITNKDIPASGIELLKQKYGKLNIIRDDASMIHFLDVR